MPTGTKNLVAKSLKSLIPVSEPFMLNPSLGKFVPFERLNGQNDDYFRPCFLSALGLEKTAPTLFYGGLRQKLKGNSCDSSDR